ncbi:hypothetical protein PoB_005586600 [Plakobranchus ocellatus]|uniref:Uncharacterized protein n=1 Tax=Plakobranchus ocellatus TaxID=259542 RepID=A0AAV4C9G3_9GAST|nr:hypothetical protein PoB_005586600 [Plakobranchus ocellatus]
MSRLRKITSSEARNLLSDALFDAFDSDSSADESDSVNRFHFDDEFVGEDDASSGDPDFTTHQAIVSSDDISTNHPLNQQTKRKTYKKWCASKTCGSGEPKLARG